MLRKLAKMSLVVISMIISLSLFAQTKEDDPYFPSPHILKAAGIWTGTYGDVNFKMMLRVKKRYIAKANYSSDFLEGNYVIANANIASLNVDTAVTNIWDGHFANQQEQDVIVLRFKEK